MNKSGDRNRIALDPADREELERRMRSAWMGPRERVRAWAVLLAADGFSNSEIERRSGLDRDQVATWRRRFVEQGIRGLDERSRSGRPRTFGAEIHQILAQLAATRPPGEGRWTIRSLKDALTARADVSISVSQVRRILLRLGLRTPLEG
jgi:transposase